MKNFLIKTEKIRQREGHCGKVRDVLDDERISIDIVDIEEAEEHYHNNSKEYYYILEGKGSVYLDGNKIDVEASDLVVIPPRVRHKAVGRMKVLIIAAPPLSTSDSIITK
ncbi:hypothetical protein DRN74_03240 [Candidatus Micrarchaeota archaeon]|nr:MAG: hypothetical protein DRN74_03240 [Candidatus Micrarchaeota archaeon]